MIKKSPTVGNWPHALAVSCPYCQAAPGERCRKQEETYSGELRWFQITYFHRQRVAKAYRLRIAPTTRKALGTRRQRKDQ